MYIKSTWTTKEDSQATKESSKMQKTTTKAYKRSKELSTKYGIDLPKI